MIRLIKYIAKKENGKSLLDITVEYTDDNGIKHMIKFNRDDFSDCRIIAKIFDEYNQRVYCNAFVLFNNKFSFYGSKNIYYRGMIEYTFRELLDIIF